MATTSPTILNWLTSKFELARGDGTNQRSMEGLRGFAVFLVFLVHYSTLVEPWLASSPGMQRVSHALHAMGNTGVDLFFVLSGYLIYGSLMSRPQPFPRFIGRRIARIYPAFLVVLALYTALSFLFPGESKLPASAAAAARYVVANLLLLPGLFPIQPMITVAWSLSYEMFYYLLIPGVIGLLSLRTRSARWRATFCLGAALATTLGCVLAGGPIRLIMFIAGMLLFEAMASTTVPTPSSHQGATALGIALLSTLLPAPDTTAYALKVWVLFVAFFIVCLSCFRQEAHGWLPRALCWTPLRWLGNMSYSYYLLHGLALKAGFLVLAKLWPATGNAMGLYLALLPLMFLLTLIPTSALFLLVERPLSLAPHPPKRA